MSRKRRIAETGVILGLCITGVTAMAAADGGVTTPEPVAPEVVAAVPQEPAAVPTEVPAAPAEAAPAEPVEVALPEPAPAEPAPAEPAPAETEAAPAEEAQAPAPVEADPASRGAAHHKPRHQPKDKPKDKPATPRGGGAEKVTICHRTGSATNPFVEITISVNGLNGHGDHEGDIIPAPAGGCPATEPAPAAETETAPDEPAVVTEEPVAPADEEDVPDEGSVLSGGGSGGATPRERTTPVGDPIPAVPASVPAEPAEPAAAAPAVPAALPAAARDELPFTGLETWLLLMVGVGLTMAGTGLWLITARDADLA